ncbi:hypothetical protein K431DRAFT_142981 [Polychaeton citri CBS 116435]|uniref:Uncharacterized protein n=1 Tax=Polychaeton citri CBS 116435 TaxID=1314669 RepID=A0A9P4Q3Z3_9PEZI|nr:hypothetical protein K431DRAFT_142981 [Polychaeton citri CBS 116435]
MRPIVRLPLWRFAQPASRSFVSSSRLRLKEDKPDTAGRAEEIEKAKQDSLHKGEWKEELASTGEAHLKADKEQVNDHGDHMEDLQKQTATQSQKEHPEGE